MGTDAQNSFDEEFSQFLSFERAHRHFQSRFEHVKGGP